MEFLCPLESSGIPLGIFYGEALVRCMFTVQLICAFVFTYAKSRFTHDVAHIFEDNYLRDTFHYFSIKSYARGCRGVQ